MLHALGTTSLAITILAAAPKHQSSKFIFRTFVDGTSVGGVGWLQRASPAYVVVFGTLLTQYALTGRKAYVGFNANAHMTEEATTWLYLDPISIIVTIDAPVVLHLGLQVLSSSRWHSLIRSTTDITLLS